MSGIHPENIAAAFPDGPAAGRLPPLTLLHVLALRAMRSPLMMTSDDGRPGPAGIDDLLMALGIMRADPACMAPLVARATRDATCEQLGIPLDDDARADMQIARIELRQLALKAAGETGVDAIETLARGLQAQIDHAFTTLVPMRDPETGRPLPAGPAPA
jgi:hypothetical protein